MTAEPQASSERKIAVPGPKADFHEVCGSRIDRQMPVGPLLTKLTVADALEVAALLGRCTDYFLLQDGVVPTLSDAHELFTDFPPERNARDQTVWGWQGDHGRHAVAAILREYPREGTWHLGFMLVDAARRGQGRRRVLRRDLDWAARESASEIRLAVLKAKHAGSASGELSASTSCGGLGQISSSCGAIAGSNAGVEWRLVSRTPANQQREAFHITSANNPQSNAG